MAKRTREKHILSSDNITRKEMRKWPRGQEGKHILASDDTTRREVSKWQRGQ